MEPSSGEGAAALSAPLTDAHLSAQVSPAEGVGESGRQTDAATLQQHKDHTSPSRSYLGELHLLPLRLLHPAAGPLCLKHFELVLLDQRI